MDLSFANAVRNASHAWAQNRVTDAMTLAELSKRQVVQDAQYKVSGLPTTSQLAIIQPELARYGQVGTKLNIFA